MIDLMKCVSHVCVKGNKIAIWGLMDPEGLDIDVSILKGQVAKLNLNQMIDLAQAIITEYQEEVIDLVSYWSMNKERKEALQRKLDEISNTITKVLCQLMKIKDLYRELEDIKEGRVRD